MKYALAELLAYLLLEQHNMPLTAAVEHDPAKLPASSTAAWTRACSSCISNWLFLRGMDVADDREKMAHCHICLVESMGPDHTSVEMTRAVHYGLASRFLGKFVLSPMMRQALDGMDSSMPLCGVPATGSSAGSNSNRAAKGEASAGKPAASKPAGKCRHCIGVLVMQDETCLWPVL
jgi:hypothetical protein